MGVKLLNQQPIESTNFSKIVLDVDSHTQAPTSVDEQEFITIPLAPLTKYPLIDVKRSSLELGRSVTPIRWSPMNERNYNQIELGSNSERNRNSATTSTFLSRAAQVTLLVGGVKNSIESINSKQSDDLDRQSSNTSGFKTIMSDNLTSNPCPMPVVGSRCQLELIDSDKRPEQENISKSGSDQLWSTSSNIKTVPVTPNWKSNPNDMSWITTTTTSGTNFNDVQFKPDMKRVSDTKTTIDHLGQSLGPPDDQVRRPSSAAEIRRAKATRTPPFPYAGVLSALTSSLFFSFGALLIKLLPDRDDGQGMREKVKAIVFRGIFMITASGMTIIISKSTFKVQKNELVVNLARAILGTFGLLCFICSLQFISLGDSTALVFCSPIWTYILSHFIFAEPLSWVVIVVMPLSLVGIVLISHPTLIIPAHHLALNHHSDILHLQSHHNLSHAGHNLTTYLTVDEDPTIIIDHVDDRLPGIVLALVGSLMVSFTFIALKFRKSTPIQTTTFWFGVGQVSIALTILTYLGFGSLPETIYEWLLLTGNGIFSWVAQIFLQWSFAYEEAGVISIVRTNDVALSFVLSSIFLDDDIYWTSILGAVILGTVVVLIILNSWIVKLCSCNSSSQTNTIPRQSFDKSTTS